MSLVANYTDSEGEDEGEVSGSRSGSGDVSTNDKMIKSLRNPFGSLGPEGEEEDPDSDSSLSNEGEEVQPKEKKLINDGIQLDNPFRFFGSANVAAEDSVLRVEFREQEAQKTAVLERHVKMTDGPSSSGTINGKKICWNHRKGRCRFGHNCKFAHDTDTAIIAPEFQNSSVPDKNFHPVSSTAALLQNQKANKRRNPFCMDNYDWDKNKNADKNANPNATLSAIAKLSGPPPKSKGDPDADLSDEEPKSSKGNSNKKKRPGLVQDLVPGSKVMNSYYKHKNKPP